MKWPDVVVVVVGFLGGGGISCPSLIVMPFPCVRALHLPMMDRVFVDQGRKGRREAWELA